MGSKPSHINFAAILALLLAATLWGLIWYPLRALESVGLAGIWASLLMYLAATLVALPYIVRHRARLLTHPVLFLLIALFSGWTNIAFILSIIEGNVVRVVLLFYLSPLWAALFARIFLGEKFTPRSIFMLIVAMLGAMLMLWRPQETSHWAFSEADWLALSAGMAFAATNVTIRYAHGMPIGMKSSAAWIGVSILATAWLWLGEIAPPAAAGEILIWTFILGGIAMIVMTLTVQYGVTHMPVQQSAVILLFELVVAAVGAQLLTNEVVTLVEWVGGACIIAASLIAARHKNEVAA